MFDVDFYRAFEDYYRGSRALIKSRLAVYLPFIQPLKKFYVNCPSIDLGCGRGEWLELMQENEIDVQGVDLDQGMLEVARTRGLNVHHGDIIQYIKSLASDSQMLVSGFHLVEHLQFDTLQILIQESYRVLKSGGLLIFETPNAENITVGTEKFYLDPTHYKPIPSQLLSFIVGYSGFKIIKVLRLQEPAGLTDEGALTLLSVLNGVSPDYAVVAQKGGASDVELATMSAFDADYGLSLEYLANNYDKQIKIKIQQAYAKAQQAEIKAQQAEIKAQQAEIKAQQAEIKAQQAEFIINSMKNNSLLQAKAFREVIKNLFYLQYRLKTKFKNYIKFWLVKFKIIINRSPRLRWTTLYIMDRFPALKRYLHIKQATLVTNNLKDMSPHVRQIYAELKSVIENKMKQ